MSKFYHSLYLVLILLMLSVSNANALVINEISTYTSEDWIEIYSDTDIDLSGYEFKDSAGNNKVFPENSLIGPGTAIYLIVDFSNKLNKDKDTVFFYNKEKSLIDSVSYGNDGELCAPQEGQTIGRKPDITGPFQRLLVETKGLTNSDVEAACPTPEPTRTPTPTPIKTDSPTQTSTPNPTIVLTPTAKILSATSKPTPKSTSIATISKEEKEDRSWSTPQSSPESTPETEVLAARDKNITPKIVAGFFMLAGGVFVSFPAVKFYKSKKEEKNE